MRERCWVAGSFLLTSLLLAIISDTALAESAGTQSTAQSSKTSVQWTSAATGGAISGRIFIPMAKPQSDDALAAVVYLKNLSIPRLGQEPDQPIIDDLLKGGYIVLVLDYAKHPNAISPDLNADMLKLRQDIAGKEKKLLGDYKVDLNHLFILIEGFRLKCDVEFARDGKRVLGMDIQYPSKPIKPVPALMEITCDNANRMGTGSLLFCRDTLLDGAMVAGFAAAMIDHPVPPPYKGLDDPMPESIYRLKSAVRTLRSLGAELGLNGNIGAIGFSRGGPMAAILAVTGGRADLEGDGPHQGVSSAVQAALIHGNRYDYLNLRPDDPMLKRFEKAWGQWEANPDKWAAHGASHYLTKDAAPMFLNTSDAESPEYRDGLAAFAKKLDKLKIEYIYEVDPDGRGHRVSTDPKTLAAIYAFFATNLINRQQ